MASTVIHLCVAKEIDDALSINSKDFHIGSIAPDIGKIVGIGKAPTHFGNNSDDATPIMQRFLNKYKDKLDEDFTLGYFVHLYTDYLWDKYFVTDFVREDTITLHNGDVVELSDEVYKKFIYNDYTDMNVKLINFYDLDLRFLFNPPFGIETSIKEMPIDKITELFDKSIEILKESEKKKNYVFNILEVTKFIEFASPIIVEEILRRKKT